MDIIIEQFIKKKWFIHTITNGYNYKTTAFYKYL